VFYNKVKALADTPASIGQPLTDSEFNSYIVNGLDEDYDGLVEIINERANTNPLMAREVYSCLVLTEQRVEARRANRSRGHGASANATSRGAVAPMVLCLPPRARCPAHLPSRRHRPSPRTLLGEVVHLVYASSAAVMDTMHPCVIAIFSGVFLGSTTTARIRATMHVKQPWLIAPRQRSSKDTLSPTPPTLTGMLILRLRIT
jgi:hypothetical protein